MCLLMFSWFSGSGADGRTVEGIPLEVFRYTITNALLIFTLYMSVSNFLLQVVNLKSDLSI